MQTQISSESTPLAAIFAVLLLSQIVAGAFEYERALPACGDLGVGASRCAGARRHELDEKAMEVLLLLETDADCAVAPTPPNAIRELPLQVFETPVVPAWATCSLPAAMSFEAFSLLVSLSAQCRRDVVGNTCDPMASLNELSGVYDRYKAIIAVAAASIDLPEGLAPTVQRFIFEDLTAIGKNVAQLRKPRAMESWRMDTTSAISNALEVCRQMGLGRRTLFWKANVLQSVVEYGLGGYLSRLVPRDEFFHSRIEVLSDLLGGPWSPERLFVEVGVHLARLAYVLLSQHQRLQYVGVDPFEYDPVLTSAESAAHQLKDLNLTRSTQLSGEVRAGAEAKLALFGDRASLIPLSSVEAASQVPDQSVDGVFIDGDHSYAQVVRDLAFWEPKVRPGGFLSGHDFGNHADVARAVLERAAAKNRTVHLSMDWVWYWYV